MHEEQPPLPDHAPPAAFDLQPAFGPASPDQRRVLAWVGGMLAGIAIGVGLAMVMYVMSELSPGSRANCGIGCGYEIRGSVLIVLFLGLVIGLGLSLGFLAALPDRTAPPAASSRMARISSAAQPEDNDQEVQGPS